MIVIGKKSKINKNLIKIKKKILIFFNYINLFYIINNLYAIDPEIFVQSTVNRASKILGENISKEKKMLELKNIAKDTVDIKRNWFLYIGGQ